MSAKPWTRWWWMGSAVTLPELTRHLEAFAAAGIGGVEITPIYGVKGLESACIDYLSPRWIEILAHTLREAKRLGLGVDMTLGTGWPWGGKHVRADHAPRQLTVFKEEIAPNTAWRHDFDGAVVEAAAWRTADGRLQSVPVEAGSRELVWTTPSSGPGTLYVAYSTPTQQQVKRPAPGGEGDVMSPYSEEALQAFLKPFEQVFEAAELKPRCIFYDSFEAFGADYTPGLLDRFKREKAYDLSGHLDALAGEGDPERVDRVRCDYRDVLFASLLEGFVKPWSQWTQKRGLVSRYQAHGSPGNLLDLYAAADIPETEVFGTNRFPFMMPEPLAGELPEHYPIANKMASSAAHLSGLKRVASETFTWHREHFQGSLAEMKGELDQLFLAGINHVFFHGSNYSPESAAWPGWVFYASTHFEMAQPFWRDLPAFNAYIASCQEILQSSRVVNDILLYFPFHDVMSAPGGSLFRPLNVHHLETWMIGLPWGDVALRLWRQSYGFDIISDRLVQNLKTQGGRVLAGTSEYRVIVVPPCRTMPLDTLRQLQQLAKAGAAVVFMKDLPSSQPGLRGLEDAGEFAATMKALLPQCCLADDFSDLLRFLAERRIFSNPVVSLPGLHAMRLLRDGRCGWFVVNQSNEPVDGWVTFASEGRDWKLYDPLTGLSGRAISRHDASGVAVYLQLHPGQTCFVLACDSEEPGACPNGANLSQFAYRSAGILPARCFKAGGTPALPSCNASLTGARASCPQGVKLAPFGPWPYARESGQAIKLAGNWELAFISGGPTLPARRTLAELKSWTLLDDPETRDFSGTARYALDFQFDSALGEGDNWLLRFDQVHESVAVQLNGQRVATLWSQPMEVDVTRYLRQGANRLVCEVTNLASNRIAAMDRQGIPWRIFKDINVVNINYKEFNAAGWAPMPSGLEGKVRLVHRVLVIGAVAV